MRVWMTVISVVLFAAAATFLVAWRSFVRALDTPMDAAAGEVIVQIPPGTDLIASAGILHREGLLAKDTWLDLYIERLRLNGTIRPGEYKLSAAMRPARQIAVLEAGEIMTHAVGIPRGSTLEQAAEALAKAGIGDEATFLSLMHDPGVASRLGVPADRLAGYLHPDVYELERGKPPEEILAVMVERTRTRLAPFAPRMAELGLDLHQLLTLASLIETAAVPDPQRRMYAAVLRNRLEARIALEHAAADDYGRRQRPAERTPAEWRREDPWNTTDRAGLPAGPIVNPSLDSVEVVTHAVDSDALYFLQDADGAYLYCPDQDCFFDAWRRIDPLAIPRIPRRFR